MTTQHERPLVSRTYRAAIRTGEDFITLEETITLPLDATDDDILRAVDLGQRIYQAQRGVADETIAEMRGGVIVSPEAVDRAVASFRAAPASEKQIAFIRSLAADLDYTDEYLDTYARTAGGYDLFALTKDEASALISLLKKETREERIIDWSKRVSGAPAEKPGAVGSADIPF